MTKQTTVDAKALTPEQIADHIGVTPHSDMRPWVVQAVRYAREQDAAQPAADGFVPTHRHVKRGNDYQVIGTALVQTDRTLRDMESVIIYRGADGKMWVRSPDEFNDGRFEVLPASPTASQGRAGQ